MRLFISYIAIIALTTHCKVRRDESALTSSSDGERAWYLVDTQSQDINSKKISICIDPQSNYLKDPRLQTEGLLRQAVKESYATWIKYIDDKEIERSIKNYPNYVRLRFPRHVEFDCRKPDLNIFAGFLSEEMKVFSGIEEGLLARVVRTDRTQMKTWGQGFIWLAPPAELAPKDTINSISYSNEQALQTILLHEFGHIFGNGHVPGTIMDPDIVTRVSENEKAMNELFKVINRDEVFGATAIGKQIDLIKELAICDRCDNHSESFRGEDLFESAQTATITQNEKNLSIQGNAIGNTFTKPAQEITKGRQIFERGIAGEERHYQSQRYSKKIANVTWHLERNWGDIKQPSLSVVASCGDSNPSLFTSILDPFVLRYWETTRFPISGDTIVGFENYIRCRGLDQITSSFVTNAISYAAKKENEILEQQRNGPLPSIDFTYAGNTAEIRDLFLRNIEVNHFGGCAILPFANGKFPTCLAKLGSSVLLYMWNQGHFVLVNLFPSFLVREKLADGYEMAYGGNQYLILNQSKRPFSFGLNYRRKDGENPIQKLTSLKAVDYNDRIKFTLLTHQEYDLDSTPLMIALIRMFP